MDKLSGFNIESKVRKGLTDITDNSQAKKNVNDLIVPGIVVSNKDPKNNKRIKVRIPVLDDHYFRDDKDGIDDLPWALPINKRLVDIPDEKTTVLIFNFSLQDNSKCRIYMDVFDLLDDNDMFDAKRLTIDAEDNWQDAEKLIGRKYDVSESIKDKKYKTRGNQPEKRTGLKGKGKNQLIFDEKEIDLTQNKGEKNESNIKLNEKAQITPAKEIELLSKKSNKKKKPIFAEDFTDLEDAQLAFFDALEKLLTTSPATTTVQGAPCTASPSAPTISVALQKLKLQYQKFKQEGISQNILIN
jgi:hypothetical protein